MFKSAAEYRDVWNQKQHLGLEAILEATLEAVSALHHNYISLGTTEYPGEIENDGYAKLWEVKKMHDHDDGLCENGESVWIFGSDRPMNTNHMKILTYFLVLFGTSSNL